jgi:diguanylate cyclase
VNAVENDGDLNLCKRTKEACMQARAWADACIPSEARTVNVAGRQFQAADFLVGLFATLGATGLNPESLELDIAESVLMEHPERTAWS